MMNFPQDMPDGPLPEVEATPPGEEMAEDLSDWQDDGSAPESLEGQVARPGTDDLTASDDDISARVGAEAGQRKDAGAIAHQIGMELKHLEADVRRLLESVDPKRKRKLNGTRRWQELEDDLIAWRFSGQVSETQHAELRRLVARRHSLFSRLHFLAGTRPTWNT